MAVIMRFLTTILIAGVAAAPAPIKERPVAAWRKAGLPHFELRLERTIPLSGLSLDLERLHNRLRLDLGPLAPWLDKEKIGVYLYASSASYHSGEFAPPAWSNGLALADKRAVVAYEQRDRRKQSRVLSHEATHLLFERYFAEGKAAGTARPPQPPLWLDEGLAMLMEDATGFTSDADEKSVWSAALRVYKDYPGLDEFLKFSPSAEADAGKIEVWYVEAYGLTRFLFREHPRGQFKTFCERLREGKDLQAALWSAYGYQTLPAFENAWRRSLKLPPAVPAAKPEAVSKAGHSRFVPISFSSPTFHR